MLSSLCHFYIIFNFSIGGLAGAASRITSAMAKGVAAITMDEDYQQKRREAMNKQPTGLKEGITRGGKGLVSVRNITLEKISNFIQFIYIDYILIMLLQTYCQSRVVIVN